MLQDQLKTLGLSSEESDIYLSLLELGTSSVSNISQKTKIGRVNCYHYIEKLLQKGLISTSSKSKIKQFTAENPKIFINRQIEKLNLAKTLVPELMALTSSNPLKPKISFFEGKSGIKSIFEQMIETQPKEIVSFSNFERLSQFLPEFLTPHFEARTKQGIKTRFIAPRTETAESFTKEFYPETFAPHLLEVFLISPNEFYFESEITIFSDSIAIINLNESNPIGILIENPQLYHTQKAIFDLAWLGATSFITH